MDFDLCALELELEKMRLDADNGGAALRSRRARDPTEWQDGTKASQSRNTGQLKAVPIVLAFHTRDSTADPLRHPLRSQKVPQQTH